MGVHHLAKRPETMGIRVEQTNMERGRDNLNRRPDYKSE
jgi:hypothetical protein